MRLYLSLPLNHSICTYNSWASLSGSISSYHRSSDSYFCRIWLRWPFFIFSSEAFLTFLDSTWYSFSPKRSYYWLPRIECRLLAHFHRILRHFSFLILSNLVTIRLIIENLSTIFYLKAKPPDSLHYSLHDSILFSFVIASITSHGRW